MEDSEGDSEDIDEILKLYSQTTATETTTFDILDAALDERTHTKYLRWALDPDGSHGLGVTFLNRCLNAASQVGHAIEEVDEECSQVSRCIQSRP